MTKIESGGIAVEVGEEDLKTIAGITAKGKRRRKETEIIEQWSKQYLEQNKVDRTDKNYLKDRKLFKEALGNTLEDLESSEEVIDVASIEEQVNNYSRQLMLEGRRGRPIEAGDCPKISILLLVKKFKTE